MSAQNYVSILEIVITGSFIVGRGCVVLLLAQYIMLIDCACACNRRAHMLNRHRNQQLPAYMLPINEVI